MLTHASLALENVSMRLNTVSEVGDLVAILAPATDVLNNICSGMPTVLPEASQELENIGSLLNDTVTSTSQSSERPVNIGTSANADAEKILMEAELEAEIRLRNQFPEVNAAFSINKRTSVEV